MEVFCLTTVSTDLTAVSNDLTAVSTDLTTVSKHLTAVFTDPSAVVHYTGGGLSVKHEPFSPDPYNAVSPNLVLSTDTEIILAETDGTMVSLVVILALAMILNTWRFLHFYLLEF